MAKQEGIRRTGYMSEIDIFLREFDKNRTQLPASRVQEIEKYRKIFAKRDNVLEEPKEDIWEKF